MKKIIEIVAMSALLLTIVSCGAAKKAVQETLSNSGKQKVEIPLDGPQYLTDAEYFRAVNSGISKNMDIAKDIALQNARILIANMVQASIQTVVKQYRDQLSGSADETGDFYEHYQRMGVTISNVNVSGAELVGQELYQLQNGAYEYHVCLQLSKGYIAKQAVEAAKKYEEKEKSESLKEHKFNEKEFEAFFVEAIKVAK